MSKVILRAPLAAAAIVVGAAVTLLAMGRPLICACGHVALWHGAVDAGNSQHLLDWYSPSHLIHGLIFYAATWALLRRMPFRWRLVAALIVEAGWEIVENSPWIIDRYRTATIALGYTGDSVVNSLSDIGCMAAGFWLARRLPVTGAVTLAVGLELLTLWVIRDNLTLNVLMLVWPVAAIRQWQAGVGA